MGRKIELVVNPTAGGGRAGRSLGAITGALVAQGFEVDLHPTTHAGHARELARELVEARAPLVGVVGGDGSFHEAINGLLSDDGALVPDPATAFVPIPAGTGGDFAARTLQMPSGPEALASWVARAKPRAMDLGRLEYTRRDGTRATSLFVNIASCGMSGRVDELVAKGPRWLRGSLAYLVASLRALPGWRNLRAKVLVDGETFYDGGLMTVAVANGRAFGGGMLIAPEASPDDGRFDVVVLGDLTIPASLLLSPHLYTGGHVRQPRVLTTRGRVVEIVTEETHGALDVDGETPGRAPARFTVLPGAVQVLSS